MEKNKLNTYGYRHAMALAYRTATSEECDDKNDAANDNECHRGDSYIFFNSFFVMMQAYLHENTDYKNSQAA